MFQDFLFPFLSAQVEFFACRHRMQAGEWIREGMVAAEGYTEIPGGSVSW